MKKNIIVFAAGTVVGALGMKFAPKLMSSLKRDDNDVDELMDEFDELVDDFDDIVGSFEESKEAPTPEPTEASTPEPTPEPTPSLDENGEKEKGGDNNEQ